MVAILDLTSERTAFRYTPYNLGVVLHTLHPRPKVLITGAAITAEMTAESVEVWEDYVREMGEAEGLVINVRDFSLSFFLSVFLLFILESEAG